METMLRLCEERQDNWSFEVKGRLLTCGDLHAAEAVYHKSCHRDFCHPKSADYVNVSAGRCVDHEKSDVFDVVCDVLQNGESELYTENELIDLMKSLVADDSHVYSFPYMKQNSGVISAKHWGLTFHTQLFSEFVIVMRDRQLCKTSISSERTSQTVTPVLSTIMTNVQTAF